MQASEFNIIWLKTLNQQNPFFLVADHPLISTTFQPVAENIKENKGLSWLRNWLTAGWRCLAVGWLVVGVSLGTPNTTSCATDQFSK